MCYSGDRVDWMLGARERADWMLFSASERIGYRELRKKAGGKVSDDLHQLLSEWFENEQIKREKLLEKYPPDVPNSKCLHAFFYLIGQILFMGYTLVAIIDLLRQHKISINS